MKESQLILSIFALFMNVLLYVPIISRFFTCFFFNSFILSTLFHIIFLFPCELLFIFPQLINIFRRLCRIFLSLLQLSLISFSFFQFPSFFALFNFRFLSSFAICSLIFIFMRFLHYYDFYLYQAFALFRALCKFALTL